MTRERDEVWDEGRAKVTCYWEADRQRFTVERYQGGRPRRRTFSVAKYGTRARARKAAHVYGEELAAALAGVITERPATTKALWAKYVEAMEDGWRPATRVNVSGKWRKWQAFIGPTADPELVSSDDLDRFHKALKAGGMAPNQRRLHFALLREVYRLAQQRRWATNPDVALYRPRIAKDEAIAGRVEPAEYTPEEWRALLGVVTATDRAWWRLGVTLMLGGIYGQRINALRHLRWEDCDLDAGVLHWRAAYQKQGVALERPLTDEARLVLDVAASWRAADGYRGAWALYQPGRGGVTPQDAGPVSYQTLHAALREAETRAGVPHLPYRSFHGLRRMRSEDLYGQTGDLLTAAEWIGDRDLKQMRSYLKRGQARVASAATVVQADTAGLGLARQAAETIPETIPSENDVAGTVATEGLRQSHWSDLNRRPQGYEDAADGTKTSTDNRLAGRSGVVNGPDLPETDPKTIPDCIPSQSGDSARPSPSQER